MKTVKVLIADYSEALAEFPETPAGIPLYEKKTKFIQSIAESDKLFDLLAEFYNEAENYRLGQQFEQYLKTKDRELDILRAYFKLLGLDVRTARRYYADNELCYILLINKGI